jgi:hypothetical protein
MWKAIQKSKLLNRFRIPAEDGKLGLSSFPSSNGLKAIFKKNSEEQRIIGAWIVKEVAVLDLENKNSEVIFDGFNNTIFIFKANYNFQFASPNKVRFIAILSRMFEESKWRWNTKTNEIEIGDKVNDYSTMTIEVQTNDRGAVFYIKETGVSLTMEKRR